MAEAMAEQMDAETLEIGVSSARVTYFVGISQVAAMLINGALLILLARLLEKDAYGIYTLAYAVATFFGAFGISGLGHYLNKYIPYFLARGRKSELEHQLGASAMVLLAMTAAAVLVGVALSGVISVYVFHSGSYTTLIDVSLLSMIPLFMMYLFYNALIGFKDGPGSATTYVCGSLGILVASVALVLLGYGPLGAMSGLLVGSLLGAAVGALEVTRHSRIRVQLHGVLGRMRNVFAFSSPLAGYTVIVGAVNSFSILFLGVFVLPAIIGSFGVAYRIGAIILTVMALIGSVLVQMFSSAMEGERSSRRLGDLYNYSVYFGTLFSAPLVAFLIALAYPFVISVFPAYKSAVLYIPALSASILIDIVGTYATSLAISMGHVKKVLKYAIVVGAVQLLLMFTLVPTFGAYGVIVGVFLAGSLACDFLYIRYVRKELRIATKLGGVYRIVAASALLALALAPINFLAVSQTLQLLAGIVATFVLYPLLLGLTGSVGRKELEILRQVSGRIPALGGALSGMVAYTARFVR